MRNMLESFIFSKRFIERIREFIIILLHRALCVYIYIPQCSMVIITRICCFIIIVVNVLTSTE